MEKSKNNNAASSQSPAPDASQRRSGRVTRAPRRFTPEAHSASQNSPGTSKRKRAPEPDDDVEDEENQAPDGDEDDEEPSDDEEDNEEEDDQDEPAPRSRKSKSSQKSKSRKPAAKRTKVNGSATADADTASAPAVKLPNRPKKTVRVAIAGHGDESGLYWDVFGSGDSSDDVAAHWFQRYQADNAKGMTELINCVLLAAGCEQKLTEDDIQDPENSANRLAELEEAYEQTSISDYPLISRSKSSKNFRDLLVTFFDSLISLLHQTDVLYSDEELMENVQRWVGIMSSSALRPFRHTATTVGLAMLTALISVTKQLDERITKSNQALQAESNRRGKNKNLVANTKKALETANENRGYIDARSKDLFDIIFVHRYRDIDPKIRALAWSSGVA
jgi:cohesin complex subunit SA-1/2